MRGVGLLVIGVVGAAAAGQQVALQNATATLSQAAFTVSPAFPVTAIIQNQDAQADSATCGGINVNDFFAFLAAYQAGC